MMAAMRMRLGGKNGQRQNTCKRVQRFFRHDCTFFLLWKL
jgi:hypothetical protein